MSNYLKMYIDSSLCVKYEKNGKNYAKLVK